MGSYRVLVVEDEGLIARDIQNRLEALGHTVVATVGTAEEALAAAGHADIVLMDIRLDGTVDGIDAAAAIRQQFHIPVIFLTAHADRSTIERAKQASPFGYIVKPLAHHSLQTSIEVAVHKHAIERQLEEREARLKESETWLRTILGAVADAVIVTDPKGRVRMHNPPAEGLFGHAPIEVASLFPGDPVALAILRDEPVRFESEVNGQVLEGAIAPVKVSGCVVGTVLTLRDVTERHSTELKNRETHKIRAAASLAADVAVEYAELLAAIRKSSGELRRRFAGYEPVRQPLEKLDQAASRAQELTERLAGLGSRKLARMEVVSLNGVIRRAPKLVEAVAGERVRCNVHTGRNGAKVSGDLEQIDQMLTNMVIYACSRMPEGGTLELETDSNGETASLTLDFFPTPSAPDAGETAEIEDGDINLSIAHSIAAAHGGQFLAQDHQLRVLLPEWHELRLVPLPEDHTRNILLVESRERVRAQLHNFFEAAGYNMLEAVDAREAATIRELHEGHLDLIICPQEAALELEAASESTVIVNVEQPVSQQALLSEVRAKLNQHTATASA